MDFTEKDVLPEQVAKRVRQHASMMAVGADLTKPGSHIFSTLRGVTLNDNQGTVDMFVGEKNEI